MSTIQGLTDAQCQALEGVQEGDIILISADTGDWNIEDDDEYANEEDSDDYVSEEDNGHGDGDNESEDDDDEDESEGAEDGDETLLTVGDEQEAPHIETDEAELAELSANDTKECEPGGADKGSEISDSRDGKSGIDEQYEHDSLVGGENVEDKTNDDRSEDEPQQEANSQHAVYLVHRLIKDCEDNVVNIEIVELKYEAQRGSGIDRTAYQIYGSDIVADITPDQSIMDRSAKSVDHVVSHADHLRLRPDGDEVRQTVFDGYCPAECDDGWLDGQDQLRAMIDDQLRELAQYKPVCPCCIGMPLTLEQHLLRETLEDFQTIDLSLVVEFMGRLNPRRRQVYYSFRQFDEREWGYMFDDMNSEGEHQDGNASQFEHWEEAMDPSNNIKLRPASEATIAALPRKLFSEISKANEDAECLVCKDKFDPDAVVVELPCGHRFCNGGCIEEWLRHFDNCPTCRTEVPAQPNKEPVETDSTVDCVTAVSNGDSPARSSIDTNVQRWHEDEMEQHGEDVSMGDLTSF